MDATVNPKDRIAQMILERISVPRLQQVEVSRARGTCRKGTIRLTCRTSTLLREAREDSARQEASAQAQAQLQQPRSKRPRTERLLPPKSKNRTKSGPRSARRGITSICIV